MASRNDKALENDMALAPKHKVFLSHSGAQKGFVEQLDLDLRQRDRHSFFDKNRESLPIGVVFPPLIFKAIQQCEVGVVILSDKFLSTKWPMLELVEMVKTMTNQGDKMKIIPVFLDVLVEDLGDEKKLSNWKAKWEEIAEFDIRIDVPEWDGALKRLKSINGLVYNSKDGDVKFREKIVNEICYIVGPFLSWDDSHVQGKSRYIEVIETKIKETLVSRTYKVQVVGLYGVGGIGKSTTCKLLRDHFDKKFYGRVCHVEFGKGTEIDSLRMILKKLTNTTDQHLNEFSSDQYRAQLKNINQSGRVFLAIDNVSSNSKVIDESKRYLGAGYEYGSIVVVTARSLEELKNVRIDADACLPMPEFEEVEAINLFLYHAAPKEEVDEKIIKKCIRRCYFRKGDGSYHYHPLALEVLGKQLGLSDPQKWELQLKEEDTNSFNRLRESENPVFSVLRRSFDALTWEDKELFIDIVVYHFEPTVGYYFENYFESSCNDLEVIQGYWNTFESTYPKKSYWNTFEWLAIVHGLSIDEVKTRLMSLKTKSLLEDLGNGKAIGMHDLWKEFALLEIKVGGIESRRWVHECDFEGYVNRAYFNPKEVEVKESILSTGGWKKLQRINICGYEHFEKSLSFTCCPNVKVLRLMDVNIEKKELVLSGMEQLRVLEIFRKVHSDCSILAIFGIKQLTNLRVFTWTNIDMDPMSFFQEISSLRNIRVLQLEFSKNPKRQWSMEVSLNEDALSLDLRKLTLLQIARIKFHDDFIISGFTSRMTKLRVLNLAGCEGLTNCHGIGDIMGLEVLLVRGCWKLKSLPNLQKLQSLLVLNISSCHSLIEVRGLDSLVALQELNAEGCSKLQSLPNLSNLTNLHVLNVKHCHMIEYISGLSNLISLEKFYVGLKSLRDFYDGGKLMKLSTVFIHGHHYSYLRSMDILNLAPFESILSLDLHSFDCQLTHLSKLTRLEHLSITFRSGFESLPNMGKNMRLKYLTLYGDSNIRGWDGVGGSELLDSNTNVKLGCNWTLAHLVVLEIKAPAFELPDLSHFPQLRTLNLTGRYYVRSYISRVVLQCRDDHRQLKDLYIFDWPFTELPDLSKLCAMETLQVHKCTELTRLTSSKPLMTLKDLCLSNCMLLKELPPICHMQRLQTFGLSNCGATLSRLECGELPTNCMFVDFLNLTNTSASGEDSGISPPLWVLNRTPLSTLSDEFLRAIVYSRAEVMKAKLLLGEEARERVVNRLPRDLQSPEDLRSQAVFWTL